uniref:Uncharacterized protein n=1 Tax=Ixodes ricinus TaxID=34613 RepID=A0A6B0UIG6_IXORI
MFPATTCVALFVKLGRSIQAHSCNCTHSFFCFRRRRETKQISSDLDRRMRIPYVVLLFVLRAYFTQLLMPPSVLLLATLPLRKAHWKNTGVLMLSRKAISFF